MAFGALEFPPRHALDWLMPTYEYVCTTCGSTFEEFQSIKADPLTDCRSDGCPGPVRRKIGTGAGIIFKGSGFYETDYRSDSYKKAAKAETSDSGGSGSGEKPAKESGKSSGSGGSESSGSSGGNGSSTATSAPSSTGSSGSGTTGTKSE